MTDTPHDPAAQAASATDAGAPSPGTMIRTARERARLTMEDLATQMKLARSTLDALERDNFDSLLEPVYVRGYYRKCAKLLGISEKELIEAYQALVAPKAPSAPSKLRLASGSELGSGSKLPLWMSAGAAVFALIVGSLAWNFFKAPQQPPPMLPAPAETAPAAPAATEAAPAATTTDSAGAVSEAPPPAAAEAPAPAPVKPAAAAATPPPRVELPVAKPAPAPIVTSSAGVATSNAKPDTATPPVAGEEKAITLEFAITSWARISDGNGKTLLNSLMHAGDKRSFRAPTPFAVFLGNAPGVTAQYDGKPVDLAKYTGDNLTARFTLPEKH